MMITKKTIASLMLIFLFAWAMSAFFSSSLQIADYYQTFDQARGFSFELNFTPIVVMILASILFVFFHKKKNNHKKKMLLPDEFQEDDEREQMLTAKACRASYISMWYTFPVLAVAMLFYPFWDEAIPAYPIFVLLLFPSIQVIVYYLSWRRNEKIS